MNTYIITVKLKGGLGNQMFQYAFGRKLSLKHRVLLRLDKSLLERGIKQMIIGTTPREYELGEFDIKAELTDGKGKNCFEGFWQSEKYFKDIRRVLLKDFTLKKETDSFLKYKRLIAKTNSVSIHIRRGDYLKRAVTRKYHGVLNLDYYRRAMELIVKRVKNPRFFVFSDDPTISDFSGLTNSEELILMSFCKHNIIANSSFSWWGAWLNKNPSKVIIAPKRWFRKERTESGIVPQGWIRVENNF